MRFVRHPRAETLAEVIIAITMLGLAAGGAITLLTTSLRATFSGETRLVAYNLAREGVEAVRNIRDTNVLKFPSNVANCWDTYNVTDPTTCDTTNQTFGGISSMNFSTYLISPPITNASTWQVTDISPTPTADATLCPVDFDGDSTNGVQPVYIHQTPCPTTEGIQFERVVRTWKDSSSPPFTLAVWSEVTWQEGSVEHTISFYDQLIQ